MKYLLSAFFIVFFQGCISTNNEKTYPQTIHVNKDFQTQLEVKNKQTFTYVKQSKSDLTSRTSMYSGSIKGIVQKISYNKLKKSWLYEVQGVDTSHDKLPYAKFYHHKKLANEGDLVYVVLNNSQMQNLFFIKKANKIKKLKKTKHFKTRKTNQKKARRTKTPWIALPAVEHVDF